MGQCTLSGTEGNQCNSCWWPRPSAFCLLLLGAPHHNKDTKSSGSSAEKKPQDHPGEVVLSCPSQRGTRERLCPVPAAPGAGRGWGQRGGGAGQSPAPAARRRLPGGAGAPRGGNEEASAGHFSMLSQSNICLVNKYIVVFFSEEMRRLQRKIMKGLSCAVPLGTNRDQALLLLLGPHAIRNPAADFTTA